MQITSPTYHAAGKGHFGSKYEDLRKGAMVSVCNGHGRLTLRHTFADEHCKCEPGHTNNHNLMDYVVTNPSPLGGGWVGALNRFQWETAHNPAPIGKVFQDDEDGAVIKDEWVLRKYIEQFRFAYINNTTFKLPKLTIASVSNVKLADEAEKYTHIKLVAISKDPVEFRPDIYDRNSFEREEIHPSDGLSVLQFPNGFQIRVTPNRKNDLLDYLFANEDLYYIQIDNYVNKIAKSNDDLLKVIETITLNERSVVQLFHSLNDNVVFSKSIYECSHWVALNNCSKLIKELTALYYKNISSILSKDQLTQNHLFKWHKSQQFNVMYSTQFKELNRCITFKADLEYWFNNGNEREIIEYEPSVCLKPFDIIGVDFSTSVNFIGIKDSIFPMPVFLFDWMIQEYKKQETINGISLIMYVASFAVGVGEIQTARKAWMVAVSLMSLFKASGDLYFELNENVELKLSDSVDR
jgi:hypothetical protein